MAEAVGRRGLGLGYEGAVRIVDALGNRYQAVALLFVDLLDVREELLHVEVGLRQVNQIRACAHCGRKTSSAGQPARVTAHDLHDADHAGVVYARVLIDLHAGGRDILGSGSKARAVVGAEQVVVDGLRDAHDAALIAGLHHILGNLIAGIHGVVAAIVEEIADVVLLKDLKDALVIGVVHIRVSQLVAAGAECGGRGVAQQRQLFAVFLVDVVQVVVQQALDAVCHAENAGNCRIVQRSLDRAKDGRIDNRSRAARLADDASAFQFAHNVKPPNKLKHRVSPLYFLALLGYHKTAAKSMEIRIFWHIARIRGAMQKICAFFRIDLILIEHTDKIGVEFFINSHTERKSNHAISYFYRNVQEGL